ncbi:GNAT family N-acetyltransferase, partial [Lactobacillus amylovorus]|uniref:GNAT family N-acetyltransferase n=1 Tax=Lactobacillus amylovorus TaxID=1604 RepID=UPI003F8CD3B3
VHARGYIAITSSIIEYLLVKLLSFQGFIVLFGVGSLSHKDYQGQGIASAICDELESSIKDGKIVTHASITARPFFKARGYIVVRKQKVVRDGIELINFVMEKK